MGAGVLRGLQNRCDLEKGSGGFDSYTFPPFLYQDRSLCPLHYGMSVRAAFDTIPVHSPVHNRVAADDQAVHRWFRFVLSFPPHLVREYLAQFNATEGQTVLDPFCGTGTTLVECKKLGIESFGIEAAPMAAFASSTKVNWHIAPDALRRAADVVIGRYERTLEREGFIDTVEEFLRVRETRSLFGHRGLNPEQEQLLLKGSISPLPLHKTLTLLQAIRDSECESAHSHMELALAWSLVNETGNIRFGPEVGISKPKSNADVFGSWHRQVTRMADDLAVVGSNAHVAATVHHSDSRTAAYVLQPNSIDFVITSPPYPNEKDYTRTTRLESVILGFITTKEQLRGIKKTLVRSNTRSVYVADEDHLHVEQFRSIQDIAAQIEAKRIAMGKTSGFERLYHRVTKLYFGGMRRHLLSLRTVLRPGARLAYVVGDQASYLQVMIRTGQLLGEIAESCGYVVESIDLFRTRLATATKEQLREEIVVLRWPG